MVFSYMDVGAGSRAEFTRPHLPTADPISGMVMTCLSILAITSIFSEILECGMVVGISKNDPSFKAGINSFPNPGRALSSFSQTTLFLVNSGIKPRTLPNPNQMVIPKKTTRMGINKNFHLLSKHQVKMLL